jgi:hypothetical protein
MNNARRRATLMHARMHPAVLVPFSIPHTQTLPCATADGRPRKLAAPPPRPGSVDEAVLVVLASACSQKW